MPLTTTPTTPILTTTPTTPATSPARDERTQVSQLIHELSALIHDPFVYVAQVYPGGFVWVYAGLRKLTNDGKVRIVARGGGGGVRIVWWGVSEKETSVGRTGLLFSRVIMHPPMINPPLPPPTPFSLWESV